MHAWYYGIVASMQARWEVNFHLLYHPMNLADSRMQLLQLRESGTNEPCGHEEAADASERVRHVRTKQ